jgi:DNA-binding MarR family transcriptional regulator
MGTPYGSRHHNRLRHKQQGTAKVKTRRRRNHPTGTTNAGAGFPKRMRQTLHTTKGHADILSVLALFEYLTAEQVTRLCYAKGSLTYVTAQLKALVDRGLALSLGGRGTNLPLIYTLTGKGRSLASTLSGQQPRRFRPKEAWDKQANLFFMRHLLSVNDVLITARLLSQTRPDILLTKMYREPELRRRIYVDVPFRIWIEPDACCQFLVTEIRQERPETWEDCFFIELYRTLPAVKERYKQKIQGYVTYVDTGQHEALFQTPALSIAVIAQPPQMAALLKY